MPTGSRFNGRTQDPLVQHKSIDFNRCLQRSRSRYDRDVGAFAERCISSRFNGRTQELLCNKKSNDFNRCLQRSRSRYDRDIRAFEERCISARFNGRTQDLLCNKKSNDFNRCFWRSRPDSNWCRSFCRALPSHSATGPFFVLPIRPDNRADSVPSFDSACPYGYCTAAEPCFSNEMQM